MNRKISAILMTLAMMSVALANVPAVFAGSPSSSNEVNDIFMPGDWIVVGAEIYTNEIITVNGNITIPAGATLTLVNTTVLINSTVSIKYHIEVQGTGSLIMSDGGDGLNPMDVGDSDSSIISANDTAYPYYFWIRQGASVAVGNSEIHYAGNNTNDPPNNQSGIWIQSDSVMIQGSLIADNNHALLYDSCLPALLMGNNISDNNGIGLGIGNWTNPFYNITGTVSNNNIINNGGYGLVMYAPTIDVEVFNLNVSANNYGINIYGDVSSIANIHDCVLWRSTGSSDSGASGIYVYANGTGTVDATVTECTVIENYCGGVRIGYYYNDVQSGTTTALVANNTLIGNEGGNMVNAEGNVNAKVVDNYLGGSDYHSRVDRYKLGMDPGNDVACQNLTFEYSRNEVWCGKAGDGWNTAGVLQTGAQNEMNATIVDNEVRGGSSMGGVFFVGASRNDWDYIPLNLTAYVEGNYIEMLYDHDSSSEVEMSYVFTFDSLLNTDLTFINNVYYSTNAPTGGPDYGNAVLYMGADDGEDEISFNLTALIQGNSFITRDQYADDQKSAYIWGNAKLDLDVTIKDNYFEYVNSADPDEYMNGFIIFGDPRDADYGPKDAHIDIIDNTMNIYIPDGNGIAPWGLTRFSPNASSENTFLNYTGNDVTIVNGISSAYLVGTLIMGNADDDEFSKNVTAVINDNNIFADFGPVLYTSGGSMILNAWDNLDVTMNNNNIEAIMTDESGSYPFGVRLGYYCNSQGIVTENTTVRMTNNNIITGGKNSAVLAGANHNLDFEFDGGEITKAYYGNCGGFGSFGTEYSYGNGIVLLSDYMNATIKNANIHHNRGAGIYVDVINDAKIDIQDCYIHENYWHGIFLQSQNGIVDATGSITGCTITDNGADLNGDLPGLGSGLYCDNAVVDVVNCTFDNPSGDVEFEIMSESHVTALNTTFDKDSVFLDSAAGFVTGGAQPETTWATWAALGNTGYFRIMVDGVTADVGPVDLTAVANGATVATRVTTALVAAGFTGVTCAWTGAEFVITSGTTGNQSTTSALTTHSGALGTDISGVVASTGVTAWWLDCAANGTSTDGPTATLLVQWYMHVKAEQLSSGVGLPGTSVTVRDVTGAVVGTGTTANDGWRRWLVVDEYFQNVTQSNTDRTHYTPHSVSATKAPATGNAVPDPIMDITKDVIVILDYTSLPPTADAGPDQTVDEDTEMTFDGSGSTDDFWITNWIWTIAGIANGTLYGETVNYTFTEPGVYIVTLTVTDYELTTDTDEVTITVVDITLPIADAGPDQTVNEDTLVTFDGSGSTDNVGIDNYTWTFTDDTAQTLYGVAPTYTYNQPGVFMVTLTVSDAAGNTATDTVVITVLDITPPVPDPGGAGQTVPEGDLVTFDGSGSTDNVGIVSYEWTFNDGANNVVLTGVSPNYTFALIGNHTVSLTCTDAAGNSATVTTYVNVIDITPPEVLVVAPGESLTGVPLDWTLVIVFTEAMDQSSVEAAFSISGGTVTDFVWDTSYVRIELDGLDFGTQYTFTINTSAVDLSGNPLTEDYSTSFTTITTPLETPSFFEDYWWIIIVIILVIILILQAILGRKKEPESIAFEEEPQKPAETPKPEAETKVEQPAETEAKVEGPPETETKVEQPVETETIE